MFILSKLETVLLTSVFFLFFSFLTAPPSYSQNTSGSNSFTILFSNNMTGEYKPCGWKPNKLGGLSGKATLIDHERKTSGDSLLLLDSGKSLFKGKNNNNQIPLIQARGIAKAYILMGYDAVSLSATDVMEGELFLEETLKDGFPWISANVVDNNGHPITRPYVLKTINSINIAIIGLTDTLLVAGQYSTIDYTSPLTTLLSQLTAESDMIIVLSNLQANVNQKIAKQFPEIDIIFSSDPSLGKMASKVVNNTLITQTSNRGKYLGKLDVEWNSGKTWYNDRLLPLSELRKRRTTIESQLIQIKNNTDTSNKKKVSRLQLQQLRLEKEIETRIAQERENDGHPYNKHRLHFVPVQPVNSPASIESIVENIDRAIKEQTTN